MPKAKPIDRLELTRRKFAHLRQPETKHEEPPKENTFPCPNCGLELIHEAGCIRCPSCGWSKC